MSAAGIATGAKAPRLFRLNAALKGRSSTPGLKPEDLFRLNAALKGRSSTRCA